MMRFFRLRLAQRFGNLLVIWDGSPIAFDGSQGDAKYLHDLGPPLVYCPRHPCSYILGIRFHTLILTHCLTLPHTAVKRVQLGNTIGLQPVDCSQTTTLCLFRLPESAPF